MVFSFQKNLDQITKQMSKNNLISRHCFTIAIALCALLTVHTANGESTAGNEQMAAVDSGAAGVVVIDAEDLKLSGIQNFRDFLNQTPAISITTNTKYLVNGRATNINLDGVPISAIDRIEIYPAGSFSTLDGNFVGSVINIVMKQSIDSSEFQIAIRNNFLKGGDHEYFNYTTGSTTDSYTSLININFLAVEEIRDADRPYSEARYTTGGKFTDAQGLSYRGNTIFKADFTQSAAIGDCDTDTYTGPLEFYTLGEVCAYPYADHSWQSIRTEHAIVSASIASQIDDKNELYSDFQIIEGDYMDVGAPVPSTDFEINTNSLSQIPDGFAANETIILAHRFVANGNRTNSGTESSLDLLVGIRGKLTADISHDTSFRFYQYDRNDSGKNYILKSAALDEINTGNYDVENPLSDDTDHLMAVDIIDHTTRLDSFQEEISIRSVFSSENSAGTFERLKWDVGLEYSTAKLKDEMDQARVNEDVLGSYIRYAEGERKTSSLFGELEYPVSDSADLIFGARYDDHDDVDSVESARLEGRFQVSEQVALRAYLSEGGNVPNFYDLHGTTQYHPWITDTNPCGTGGTNTTYQVTTDAIGNPDAEPADTSSYGFRMDASASAYSLNAEFFVVEIDNGLIADPQTIVDMDWCGTLDQAPGAEVIRGGDGTVLGITVPTLNILSQEDVGALIGGQYRWDLDNMKLTLDGQWARILDRETEVHGSSSPVSYPENQVSLSLTGSQGNITAALSTRFISSFENASGTENYDSWMGHDAVVKWDNAFGGENFVMFAGVLNFTDEGPPEGVLSTNAYFNLYPNSGRTFYVSGEYQF